MTDFEDRKWDPAKYDEHYFNNGYDNVVSYDDYMNCQGIVFDLAKMIHNVYKQILGDHLDKPQWHLDVGCAYGHLGKKMQELGWETCGFDISDYAIQRAQDLYPTILFWQGFADHRGNYILREDQNGAKYDLITANCVLEHIPTSLITSILGNMAQSAKWGFFILECKTSPFEDPNHVFNEDPTHMHCHDKAWWVEMLSKYGELHWDAMYEFAKMSEQYDPQLTWGKNCFLVRFK